MNYHEFTIHVPDESREALIGRVSDMGVLGIVEREREIVAYFDGQRDFREISGSLLEFRDVLESAGLAPDISFECSTLAGQDWGEEWKKNFAPINIGEGLVIVPSWLDHDTQRTRILIDPGMAFGTGQHGTTFMCLELLEKYAGDHRGGRFLDVGTGTGVLAIAASKLGLGHVTCIDNDPLAVEAALKNAELNGIQCIDVRQGDINAVNGKYDLITANLYSGILIEIAGWLAERLDSNGTAVLSGILSGQETGVIEAMQSAGLALKEKAFDDKWIALVFDRN